MANWGYCPCCECPLCEFPESIVLTIDQATNLAPPSIGSFVLERRPGQYGDLCPPKYVYDQMVVRTRTISAPGFGTVLFPTSSPNCPGRGFGMQYTLFGGVYAALVFNVLTQPEAGVGSDVIVGVDAPGTIFDVNDEWSGPRGTWGPSSNFPTMAPFVQDSDPFVVTSLPENATNYASNRNISQFNSWTFPYFRLGAPLECNQPNARCSRPGCGLGQLFCANCSYTRVFSSFTELYSGARLACDFAANLLYQTRLYASPVPVAYWRETWEIG